MGLGGTEEEQTAYILQEAQKQEELYGKTEATQAFLFEFGKEKDVGSRLATNAQANAEGAAKNKKNLKGMQAKAGTKASQVKSILGGQTGGAQSGGTLLGGQLAASGQAAKTLLGM